MTKEETDAISWCFSQGFKVDFIPITTINNGCVDTIKIVINNKGKKTIVPDKETNVHKIIKIDDLWMYERKLYVWFYKKHLKIVDKKKRT